MTRIESPQRFSWPGMIGVALVAAALVVAATFVMFSTFMVYDDEGYVLLSLRNFAEHGGLYRDVYTQYGPFPFVFYYVLHGLGIPLTHTAGRLITIGAWTIAALSCAALVGRATRNVLVRSAVLAAVFVYLWVMASEPSHPGGIIVVLTTLLALLGYRWILADSLSRWAVAAGAGIAALVLTKINIGVFAAFSAGAWLLLHHRHDAVRRWSPAVVGVGAVLLPLGLMRPLLSTPWVQTFALVFATSAVSTILTTASGATGRTTWQTLGLLVATAAGIGVVVTGVVLVRGTGPRDLLEGILLGPLRHPGNFSLRYVWPTVIHALALASCVLCVACLLLRRRHRPNVDSAVAWLRVGVTLAFAINLARYPTIAPEYSTLGFGLPCLWLFVWPFAEEAPAMTHARAWLALLLVGQSLHAFPVPGSQIAWGTVLAVPLAALGAWEAAQWLARQHRDALISTRAAVVVVHAAMLLFVIAVGAKFATVAGRYRDGKYLGLPGAEVIRLPDDAAARYHVLALNAIAHADMLFSLPGMFSFNLWTDLPPPTRSNVTHWFSLLDEARQREIIRALEAHPRACVIVDDEHVDFLTRRGLAPRGLVRDYLAQNFEPAFRVDHFAFCVRRGRHVEPFLLGELLTRTGDGGSQQAEGSLLRFSLLVPPQKPIVSVELSSRRTGRTVVLKASTARVEVTDLNARGERVGAPRSATWPLSITGPAELDFYFNHPDAEQLAPGATVTLRDASGREVMLGRVRG